MWAKPKVSVFENVQFRDPFFLWTILFFWKKTKTFLPLNENLFFPKKFHQKKVSEKTNVPKKTKIQKIFFQKKTSSRLQETKIVFCKKKIFIFKKRPLNCPFQKTGTFSLAHKQHSYDDFPPRYSPSRPCMCLKLKRQ